MIVSESTKLDPYNNNNNNNNNNNSGKQESYSISSSSPINTYSDNNISSCYSSPTSPYSTTSTYVSEPPLSISKSILSSILNTVTNTTYSNTTTNITETLPFLSFTNNYNTTTNFQNNNNNNNNIIIQNYNSTNTNTYNIMSPPIPQDVSVCETTDDAIIAKQEHRHHGLKNKFKNGYQATPLSDEPINNIMDPNNTNNTTLPPSPPNTSPTPTTTTHHLKLLPLAVLVFYNVSGGPFGLEESIRAGGNYYAILGFIILPFIWSIPEALVTAECGSMFANDSSAGVAWVEEAFGSKAGLICGYLNWVSGATDNAIYPALFFEYLTSVLGASSDFLEKEDLMNGWSRFFIVSGLSVLLAAFNYTGLEIVGNASVVVCIIAMSPFIIMTIVGIPKVDPSKWLLKPNVNESITDLFDDDEESALGPLGVVHFLGVFWRPFLNCMFWNLNSFDAAASFAGETQDLHKTYPRGIFLGLLLCIIFYIMPILIATGATDSVQEDWVDGHLGAVALEIGGPLLGGWVVLAAGISNLALFEAEMSADAFQLMGMADRGYLPKIFQARSRFNTPKYGILVGLIVIVAMSVADFSQLVEMLNFNYAVSLLLEYAAFVKLRWTRKDIPRPYRIPVPDWAAFVVVLPPFIGVAILFAVSSWLTYIFVLTVVIIGLALYYLQQTARRRGWCEFETISGTTRSPSVAYESVAALTADSTPGVIAMVDLELEIEDDVDGDVNDKEIV